MILKNFFIYYRIIMALTYPALVDVSNKSDKSDDFSISMHFASLEDRLDVLHKKLDNCHRVDAVPPVSSKYLRLILNIKFLYLPGFISTDFRLFFFTKHFFSSITGRAEITIMSWFSYITHYVLLMSILFISSLFVGLYVNEDNFFIHVRVERGMVWVEMQKLKFFYFFL